MTTSVDRAEQAETPTIPEMEMFFSTLFGSKLAQWSHVWHAGLKEADWVQDVASAVKDTNRNGGRDVYTGLGLCDKRGGVHDRVKTATATGLLGLGADIDVWDEHAHKHFALPKTKDDAMEFIDSLGLAPTLIVDSGHGLQPHWLFPEPWYFSDAADRGRAVQLGRDFQAYIYLKGKEQGWKFDDVGDLPRIFRIPGTLNAKNKTDIIPVRLLRCMPDLRPTPEALALLSEGAGAEVGALGGEEREYGAVKRYRQTFPCPICTGYEELQQGIGERCWGYESDDGYAAFCARPEYAGDLLPTRSTLGEVTWKHQLSGRCGCGEVHNLVEPRGGSGIAWAEETAVGDTSFVTTSSTPRLATSVLSSNSFLSYRNDSRRPLGAAAWYGLAGEIIAALEPHTESDPAGLLAQLLTSFGSAAGRHSFSRAEGDQHYPNLYTLLVGSTSRSRKGTGSKHIANRMNAVDPFWLADHVQTGLSSGEGIIHALRNTPPGDDARNHEPLLGDKRLQIRQSEFGSVLTMMTREGNTLSAILRDGWDGEPLQSITKNAPERATEHHLSLVGHITKDELVRNLTATESANGFGNRFLYFKVSRSKVLPFGGGEVNWSELDKRLRNALWFAQADKEVRMDEQAASVWPGAYARLTRDRPGLLGALIARAEAHVLRLSLIYALLDCSPVITVDHLRAALAVWDYCERSVESIFGDAVGDPTADTILSGLRSVSPNGLTLTAISELFGRNKSANQIRPALLRLMRERLAHAQKQETGGRAAEVWFATPPSGR